MRADGVEREVVKAEGQGVGGMTDKGSVRVRSFTLQRVHTLTGDGVRLLFGPYAFVLIHKDGTPERSLDVAGVDRVIDAIFDRGHDDPPPDAVEPING